MKIIYFTDTFIPQINGVVTSIVNFSRELASRGHTIYIFSARNGKEKKLNLGKNITVKYFHASKLLINYPDLSTAYPNTLKTIREIRKIKPDIIHTHTPSPQAWVALALAKRFHIPIVSTYHTLLPDFIKHTRLKFFKTTNAAKHLAWEYTRWYYNKLDAVVTPSQAMKRELAKHGIKGPIHAISNGINLKMFYQAKKKHKGIKLLHLGRISYEKNIDQILESFKICLDKNLKLKLTIVGGGPDLSKLKALARKLKINKEVDFTGPIDHKKLRGIYNSHDIFVTASTIETEGLVILEAMACGLPVIGVKKLAVPDIVIHDKNGYVVGPGKVKKFADSIEEMVKNKKNRKKFGLYSQKESQKYSLDNSIDKIEKVYFRLKSSK